MTLAHTFYSNNKPPNKIYILFVLLKFAMTSELWKRWEGKRIHLILKNNRKYTGDVVNVNTDDNPIVFIDLIDKFGSNVTVLASEIVEIREDRKDE